MGKHDLISMQDDTKKETEAEVVFAPNEHKQAEPATFRQEHKQSNACQRLFVTQFDRVLYELWRDPKARKFSREDVLDMELEDCESEKMTHRFQNNISNSI